VFLSALLAASLSAPVPKTNSKTGEEIIVGYWVVTDEWDELTDPFSVRHRPFCDLIEFQADGVVLLPKGPDSPTKNGCYTIIEPDDKNPDWRVKLLFATKHDCTELTLKGIGVDHLKVIDHKKGSNLVYTRAAACRPIDNLKK